MELLKIQIRTGSPRAKPRAGDIRVTKKHGKQVRVRTMAHGPNGKIIGSLVSNGRPVFHWENVDD